MKKLWWLGVLCLFSIMPVIAQETCPQLVESAVDRLDQFCVDTGRNEICYGNDSVSLTALNDAPITWQAPGDIASITNIQKIRTSPMQVPDVWGLALMRIQANLPDTLPGQNVTFLLFGDTSIDYNQNAILTASATGEINVRDGASPTASIISGLESGDVVDLVGRNETSDWVYFATDGAVGWISAPLLIIDGDIETLNILPDDYSEIDAVPPTQAFYFSTGIGDSACNEAPDSGILVQTPEGVGTIELTMNEVNIQLGSTVFMQAERGHAFWIYVLEGEATMTAFNTTRVIPAGAFSYVLIDEELRASSEPIFPEAYEQDRVNHLPIVGLDESIAIADPVDEETIVMANRSPAGVWTTIDGDGSLMTLVIEVYEDNGTFVSLFDDGASACNPPLEHSIYGEGTGTLNDSTITVTMDFSCDDPDNTTFAGTTLSYTYDDSADTLTDNDGLVWTRSE